VPSALRPPPPLPPWPQLVVFVFGPGSTEADAGALAGGFERLAAEASDAAGEQRRQERQERQETQGGRPSERQQQLQQEGEPREQPQEQRGNGEDGGGGGAWEMPEAALTPREAFFAPTERVPLASAAGRVCAELLCPYPPGVPLLIPGERVGAAAAGALRATVEAGGAVVGAGDASLETILVVAEGPAAARAPR
jgi:hypothetical protein